MKTNNGVVQENGLELIPVYLCSTTANCKNPSCRMDMGDSCRHTMDKFYARNPDTVKLFEELTKRFNLTIYRPPVIGGDEKIQIIFEEK